MIKVTSVIPAVVGSFMTMGNATASAEQCPNKTRLLLDFVTVEIFNNGLYLHLLEDSNAEAPEIIAINMSGTLNAEGDISYTAAMENGLLDLSEEEIEDLTRPFVNIPDGTLDYINNADNQGQAILVNDENDDQYLIYTVDSQTYQEKIKDIITGDAYDNGLPFGEQRVLSNLVETFLDVADEYFKLYKANTICSIPLTELEKNEEGVLAPKLSPKPIARP